MGNYERIVKMVNGDKYLYKTICGIVGDDTPTEKVYEIWEVLHKQKSWTNADIERLANG